MPALKSRTAVRFASLHAAYGDCAVVRFWQSDDGLLLYAIGGTLHIASFGAFDKEGLAAFVDWLGFARIYCPETLAESMGWQKHEQVLELEQTQSCCGAVSKTELKLPEIYNVFAGSGGAIEMPPFADFCVDLSHRLRHGGGRYVGDLQGIAMTDAETKAFAHIGGVAVLPEYRALGLGSRLLQGLCAELQSEGKTVLTSTTAPLLPFYQKNGFAVYKRCCYCTPDKINRSST